MLSILQLIIIRNLLKLDGNLKICTLFASFTNTLAIFWHRWVIKKE